MLKTQINIIKKTSFRKRCINQIPCLSLTSETFTEAWDCLHCFYYKQALRFFVLFAAVRITIMESFNVHKRRNTTTNEIKIYFLNQLKNYILGNFRTKMVSLTDLTKISRLQNSTWTIQSYNAQNICNYINMLDGTRKYDWIKTINNCKFRNHVNFNIAHNIALKRTYREFSFIFKSWNQTFRAEWWN